MESGEAAVSNAEQEAERLYRAQNTCRLSRWAFRLWSVISQQDLEDAKYVSGLLKTLILQRERLYKACRECGIYWDNYCLDVHENCLILEA